MTARLAFCQRLLAKKKSIGLGLECIDKATREYTPLTVRRTAFD
jgi:hypothetical protein